MGELQEFFADEFACALLMPPGQLLIRIEQGWSIPALGAHFDVPAPGSATGSPGWRATLRSTAPTCSGACCARS